MNLTDALPLNRWVDITDLTTDHLEAVMKGPFTMEWHLGFRHGREVMEVKITKATA